MDRLGDGGRQVQCHRGPRFHIAGPTPVHEVALLPGREVVVERDRVQVTRQHDSVLPPQIRTSEHHVAAAFGQQMGYRSQSPLDRVGYVALVTRDRLDIDQRPRQLDRVRQLFRRNRHHGQPRYAVVITVTSSAEISRGWGNTVNAYVTSSAWGSGSATYSSDGTLLDAWFHGYGLGEPDGPSRMPATRDELRDVEIRPIDVRIPSLASDPVDAADVYLRLHLLSGRHVAPHRVNLTGVFGLLSNNAWTDLGAGRRGRPQRGSGPSPGEGPPVEGRLRRQVPADDRLRRSRRRAHR